VARWGELPGLSHGSWILPASAQLSEAQSIISFRQANAGFVEHQLAVKK
jgi:hypothetical protein